MKDKKPVYVAVDKKDKLFYYDGEKYIPVDGGDGGSVRAEDGKLVVDEVVQPVPVPVATIDGVDYYHKSELNIDQAFKDYDTGSEINFILPSFSLSETVDNNIIIQLNNSGLKQKTLGYLDKIASSVAYQMYPAPSDYSNIISFTKLANGYKLPATLYGVGTNVEIDVYNSLEQKCLAIYLIYDETSTILTCYYNLQNEESVATPITKIKDANNNEVNINDSRLAVTSADIGKIVGVNDNGELALIPSSGTKLYRHEISISGNKTLIYYCNIKEAFTKIESVHNSFNNGFSKSKYPYVYEDMGILFYDHKRVVLWIRNGGSYSVGSWLYCTQNIASAPSSINDCLQLVDLTSFTFVSDTVTEL